ncbi:MAG: UDP-N-acetylmuramoyl-L-alanine--D-glutamate ligase [Clostridia bacterium]|nr:UDP-N-acetylmuramoyl-L-alanine--D-glutamate ligase [Clostridia bacterium]
MTLNEYKQFVCGKRVCAIGIGVSNVPLIEFLLGCGANVTACDKKEKSQLGEIAGKLENLGVELICGEDYLKKLDFEIIFKTPGMRPDVKELNDARSRGSIVTSEMELFFELCPCKIVAVTGSDGKTTTTTLIAKMLEAEGKRVFIGGNIGTPLLPEIEKITADDFVVVELSSFQLISMRKSPDVAVITNLAPNHLDWHTDLDEYLEAKKNIFKFQSGENTLVLNHDNGVTDGLDQEAAAGVRKFSRTGTVENGVMLCGNDIVYVSGDKTEKIMEKSDIRLPGEHNVENYMAMAAALKDFVGAETIKEVALGFGGVAHRIEFVREVGGVKFYNDSIASSPSRTTAALNSFDEKIILIAGGYDKKIPFDDLGVLICQKVKNLVLVGHTADKIKAAVESAGGVPTLVCTDFKEAVLTAYKTAREGDIVVLSPACASFDLFKNFEERGNLFKQIVNEI